MNDKVAVGAHLYVDDAPRNIRELREQGHKTIVFSNSTNREFPGPRADSWNEMEQLVLDAMEDWKTGTTSMF
jgi:5'(3')-deoxyribonucleotidase